VVLSLQQVDRGKVIGDRTAGATGQPLSLDLPGGGTGRICTMRCRYLDGREFQKVGCPPDILVTPTLKGITEARDRVLGGTLKYIRTAAAR
jgi:carboxyl-terminal processing protease